MDDAAIAGLVERIYDLALDPDRWPELLGQVAAALAGHAGALEQEHAESALGAGLVVGLDPAVLPAYFDYYAQRNVLRRIDGFQDLIPHFTPVITVDEEALPKQELMRSEFYVDFLRPAGIHSALTLGLWSQSQSITALSVFRPFGRPSFDEPEVALANALHPHLVRAFRLGRNLAAARELKSGMAAGLDQAPFGVIVLGADGRLRHANRAAERLLAEPAGLRVVGGRLAATDVRDHDRLRALIGRALGAGGATGGGLQIRRGGERAPLSLIAAPFGAERFGPLTAERGVVVCVTDPQATTELPDVYLRGQLGLTATEAGVARALAAGASPTEIAEEQGVTRFTVRTHLQRIFEKTGTRRQGELVALLARAAIPGPAGA